MKKRVLAVSLVINVGLIITVLWMRDSGHRNMLDAMDRAFDADQLHMGLHAKSLSALESDDPAQVEEMTVALRMLVEAGKEGAAAHERARRLLREE